MRFIRGETDDESKHTSIVSVSWVGEVNGEVDGKVDGEVNGKVDGEVDGEGVSRQNPPGPPGPPIHRPFTGICSFMDLRGPPFIES